MAYRVLLINEAKLTINRRTLRSLHTKVAGLGLASPPRILKLFEHYNNEALRLYPPTKRIYRNLHLTGKRDPEILAANIKACHRTPVI